MLRIKRTYDPPARGDGRRILVERLWPRGMKKEAVAADAWMKEVAPSTRAAAVVQRSGGALTRLSGGATGPTPAPREA